MDFEVTADGVRSDSYVLVTKTSFTFAAVVWRGNKIVTSLQKSSTFSSFFLGASCIFGHGEVDASTALHFSTRDPHHQLIPDSNIMSVDDHLQHLAVPAGMLSQNQEIIDVLKQVLQATVTVHGQKHHVKRTRTSIKQHRTRVERLPRVVKKPAPIGPIPRMLDQLKRRCTRLLLTSTVADSAEPCHRVPAQVALHSHEVRQLLAAHWGGRSAFDMDDPASEPADAAAALADSTAKIAPPSCAKLSLLVWRAPRVQLVVSQADSVAPAGESTSFITQSRAHHVIEAYHIIPVTLLEAARFHHIPVQMRAGMVSADLRAHIDRKLDALIPVSSTHLA